MFGLSPIQIFYYFIAIVISLPIHEAMHGFAAHWLGDTTAKDEGRLTLNPLKHIDLSTTIIMPIITLVIFHFPFLAAKPVPFNPARLKFDEYGAAIVAAAGPLSNLVLAVISAMIIRFTNGHFLFVFLATFTGVNVILFIFNLFPIPPLDGSRVLYAFSPEPLQRLLESMESYGFFIILAILLIMSRTGQNPLVNLENYVLNILL